MHIGEKIKLLRRMKGFTQDELAEKINKTRALVSHIEQMGKVNHYTLQSVLKVLGISEDQFKSFKVKLTITHEGIAKAKDENKEAVLRAHKLEDCQKENKMLKEFVASQKKIIGMLERKK